MAVIFPSVVFAIVTCLLQDTTWADIVVQPGYAQPYINPISANYLVQQYSPGLRNSNYTPMKYQPAPPMGYYLRSSPDSLLDPKISKIMPSNPNQMSSADPLLGSAHLGPQSYLSRPRVPNSQPYDTRIYSVTPQGLKCLNTNKFRSYNGDLLGSPQQEGYRQDSQTDVERNQWTRSVQSNGTDFGDVNSSIPKIQDGDDVATQSTVNGTTVTDIPKLESLNEPEDKQVGPRAIGQANDFKVDSSLQPSHKDIIPNDQHHPVCTMNLDTDHSSNPSINSGSSPSQISDQNRSGSSNMDIYNRVASMLGISHEDKSKEKSGGASDSATLSQQYPKSESHPHSQHSPSDSNWLSDTYRNYYNQARSDVQRNPLHQSSAPEGQSPGQPGYSGQAGSPVATMYPNHMNPYGGSNSYNQGSYNQANQGPSSPEGGSSHSSRVPSSSSSSGIPNNPNNSYGPFRTAMNYVNKGLNNQPSDWAHSAQQWARNGISAWDSMRNNAKDFVNNGLNSQPNEGPSSPAGGSSHSSTVPSSSSSSGIPNNPNNPYGPFRTAMDYVNKGLNNQPSDWAHSAQQWARNGISAWDSMRNNAKDFVNNGLNSQPNEGPSSPGGGSSHSSTVSSSSSSSGIPNNPNNPYGPFRTAMDYVNKGLNNRPSDWARSGEQWARNGISAWDSMRNNVKDFVNNGLNSQPNEGPSSPGGGSSHSSTVSSSSSSSGIPNNPNNPSGPFRTAMDYVNKGLNNQPSDWARSGQQWARNGIVALENSMDYINKELNSPPNESARFGINQWARNGILAPENSVDYVNKGLNYQTNERTHFGTNPQWARNGLSAPQNFMNNNAMRYTPQGQHGFYL